MDTADFLNTPTTGFFWENPTPVDEFKQPQKRPPLRIQTQFSQVSASVQQPKSGSLSARIRKLQSPKTPTSPSFIGVFVDSPSRARCGRFAPECANGCVGHGYGAFHKPSTPSITMEDLDNLYTELPSPQISLPSNTQNMYAHVGQPPVEYPQPIPVQSMKLRNVVVESPGGSMYQKICSPGQRLDYGKFRDRFVSTVAQPQQHDEDQSRETVDYFGFSLQQQQQASIPRSQPVQVSMDQVVPMPTYQQPPAFPANYRSNSGMAQHPEIKENPYSDKPFECPYKHEGCMHAFARRHDLLRHMRIHTDDKPFRCERCFKAFTRQDALTRHLKISEKYGGHCRVKRGRVPKNIADQAGL